MGDKNNNLGDFLYGKLSNMDNEKAAWARPSHEVRQRVLGEILEPTQKKQKKVLFFYTLLMATVVFLLGYIGCLHKDIARLTALNQKQVKTTEVDPLLSSKKALEEEEASVPNREVDHPNWESREDLRTANHNLKEIIQEQKKLISSLRKKQEEVKIGGGDYKNDLINQKQVDSDNKKRLEAAVDSYQAKDKQQQQQINSLQKENKLLMADLNQCTAVLEHGQVVSSNLAKMSRIKPIEVAPIKGKDQTSRVEPLSKEDFKLKKQKDRNKFEIAYQLGLRGMRTDVVRLVESELSKADVERNKVVFAPTQGLHFAASPFRNFWIGTGIDLGFAKLCEKHEVTFPYKAGSGHVSTSGHIQDKMFLSSNFGTNILQNYIDVMLPQAIVDGDPIQLNFETNLALKHYQVPLEFSYQYGKKRLECIFLLGGQWNMIQYQYRIHSFSGQARGQQLDFSKAQEQSAAFAIQYWGLHIASGLNYRISKHFNIKGLLFYEYNFIPQKYHQGNNVGTQQSGGQQNSSPVLGKTDIGLAFKLRLSYRF